MIEGVTELQHRGSCPYCKKWILIEIDCIEDGESPDEMNIQPKLKKWKK